ncbi:plasmid mobilization protein [uncultured Phascolarctobacterium sp.]|uniref:plasmid mobilization protein n=1 Tax=Phascolarctobacterium faecium TaxID=33025 RepID=UPI002591BC10|nr:plasmid mobilization relaxosome protein MobC [uncultured Phascolarctobacterium sp.]
MENRKRNVQMIIRVTEEERALIEEKRQQIPTLNLSAYARKMLIDGYIITLDLQEVKGHTAQLQKIGVNVNQIAKRINETGRIYADDMDEIKRVMEEVWRLERRLLLQFKGLIK